MSKQKTPTYLTEHARSVIDLDLYKRENFSVDGYSISKVLDNIVVIKFLDTADGRDVVRNGLVMPTALIETMWRLGEVLMVGPNCVDIKVNDIVVFPGDKGIQVKNLIININGEDQKIANASFLAETRIFGICKRIEKNENKPRTTKKTSTK